MQSVILRGINRQLLCISVMLLCINVVNAMDSVQQRALKKECEQHVKERQAIIEKKLSEEEYMREMLSYYKCGDGRQPEGEQYKVNMKITSATEMLKNISDIDSIKHKALINILEGLKLEKKAIDTRPTTIGYPHIDCGIKNPWTM